MGITFGAGIEIGVGAPSPTTISFGEFDLPTYSVSANGGATSINEGSSLTFNVVTTNVGNGITLYWTANNVSTSNADFSSYFGLFTITNNTSSFVVTPLADVTTEGSETFTVSVRTTSTSGAVVATSNSITVNDTSITPVTYSINYLVVGGGGGGGYRYGEFSHSSGGGGGGVVAGTFTADPGLSWTITVGAGGTVPNCMPMAGGCNGANSSIVGTGISLTALGGGGGAGAWPGQPGGNGGGGGGGYGPGSNPGGTATQPSQSQTVGPAGSYTNYGNPGGSCNGGPGPGGPQGRSGGSGGSSGYVSSISGTPTNYATGGSALPWPAPPNNMARPGTPGTGNGGSGNNLYTPSSSRGHGGPGIVILSVPTAGYPGSAPGASVSTPPATPGQTILTFVSSGFYTG